MKESRNTFQRKILVLAGRTDARLEPVLGSRSQTGAKLSTHFFRYSETIAIAVSRLRPIACAYIQRLIRTKRGTAGRRRTISGTLGRTARPQFAVLPNVFVDRGTFFYAVRVVHGDSELSSYMRGSLFWYKQL